MDIENLKELTSFIDKSGISEFYYENGDLKIEIKKHGEVVHQTSPTIEPVNPASPSPVAATPVPSAEQEPQEDSNIHTITAPLVGTFYTASSPSSQIFINVGDRIEKGSTICIIEAMKLMNEIESEVEGEVIAVLVKNASPIEFGSPLFKIKLNS